MLCACGNCKLRFTEKNENSHNVTYVELRRNAELLTYLCNNNIRSDEDFRNTVNTAAEKSDKLKKIRNGLLAEIEQEEKFCKTERGLWSLTR